MIKQRRLRAEVLKPLKEATLLASLNGESLMVTNVIPVYHFCSEMLEESMVKFDNEDDIYVEIEAAIDKLNHYYDKISPMVGISLLLHPSYKKQILIESLQWKKEWVDSVMDHFYSSFRYYKSTLVRTSDNSPAVTTPDIQPEGIYSAYLKRKRLSCLIGRRIHKVL